MKNKKVCLAPYVTCGFRSNGALSFGFGSIQKIFTDQGIIFALLKLAAFLKTARTEDELNLFVQENKLEAAYQVIRNENGYLIDEEVLLSSSKYQRTALFFNLNGLDPEIAQKKLEGAHIVIIGCGGIGNQVACTLATAGVGKITLVDHDIIEHTNLTRQFLFDEKDVGCKKIDILQERLMHKNSSIIVEAIELEIKNIEDFNNLPYCDLIVLSADYPGAIINWCNEYCISSETPFINIGYVLDIAIIGPFVIPRKTGCVACGSLFARSVHSESELSKLLKIINVDNQAPSIGPINMVASGIASLEIIKFLTNTNNMLTMNKRMGYWTHTGLIEYQDCQLSSDCHICGTN